MPAHRVPTAKAAITGATKKNPKRFEGRADPDPQEFSGAMAPLGKASEWLAQDVEEAFAEIRRSFPWLTESSRISVEIAAVLYARMRDPINKMVASDFAQLRALMGAFGGTPASLSSIGESVGAVARLSDKVEPPKEGAARFFSD